MLFSVRKKNTNEEVSLHYVIEMQMFLSDKILEALVCLFKLLMSDTCGLTK